MLKKGNFHIRRLFCWGPKGALRDKSGGKKNPFIANRRNNKARAGGMPDLQCDEFVIDIFARLPCRLRVACRAASFHSLWMRDDTRRWIQADQAHCWHPFTRQGEWCAADHEPLVLTHGKGSWLWDSEGRRYLDGNSSIWTNIHGHAHPTISAAIRGQLEKTAHVSFLGFTHPGAAELAGRLCAFFPEHTLTRVFFSDDGSTAVECALKMAVQYRLQNGDPGRNRFIAFSEGYHGDTLGAASLGGVGRFFERFKGHGYPVTHVRSHKELRLIDPQNIAGVVIEPLIQGVNEMRPWPAGMLAELRAWCDETGYTSSSTR